MFIKKDFSEVYCQTHSNEKIKGNIFITNFRVYFNSDVNEQVLVVDIPLGFIHRVEKLYNNQINEFAGILVYCKVREYKSFFIIWLIHKINLNDHVLKIRMDESLTS